MHTCICRPPVEFNHSHMKGHLSWPFETNLAFSAINLTKWMLREEINYKKKWEGKADTLTINVTFTFIAGASVSHGFYFQSKGFINIVWPHFTLNCALCFVTFTNHYQRGFFFLLGSSWLLFCSSQFVAAVQIDCLKDTVTFSHLLIRVRPGLCGVATIYQWLTRVDPLTLDSLE